MANAIYEVGNPRGRGATGSWGAALVGCRASAVAEWFPDKEKSIAVGFFNFGTSLGALIARRRSSPQSP